MHTAWSWMAADNACYLSRMDWPAYNHEPCARAWVRDGLTRSAQERPHVKLRPDGHPTTMDDFFHIHGLSTALQMSQQRLFCSSKMFIWGRSFWHTHTHHPYVSICINIHYARIHGVKVLISQDGFPPKVIMFCIFRVVMWYPLLNHTHGDVQLVCFSANSCAGRFSKWAERLPHFNEAKPTSHCRLVNDGAEHVSVLCGR